MTRYRGPDRRRPAVEGDDHNHPDLWSKEDHHRFEDRVSQEIHNLREDVEALAMRITLMLGGLAILAFLIPILAPLVRDWLGVPSTIDVP